MPGLLFKGPRRILEVDPPNLNDFFGNSFNKLNEHSLHPPISPLTPTKHKACRPSKSQASWIFNSKEALESKDASARPRDCATCPGQCSSNESSESEHDLAAMVHEFIENGTRERDQYDSDGDNGAPSLTKLCDNLKVLGSRKSAREMELLSKVSAVLLSVNEETMVCHDEPGNECKGACVRQIVVKHLKSMGYDAAICKLKWQISGNVPGGDYEYVDVLFNEDGRSEARLILDLDFQSQFEIARPTQHYRTALKLLPTVFVGTVGKLHQVLEIMSEAAKCSLMQNSMHLPPWRTIEYMFAKWLSPHERSSSRVVPLSSSPVSQSLPRQTWNDRSARFCCAESKPCWEQIRRIKDGIRADMENSAASQKRGRGICLSRRKTNKW